MAMMNANLRSRELSNNAINPSVNNPMTVV